MSGRIRKLKWKLLAVGVALFGLVSPPFVAPAASAPIQKQGMVCTNGTLAAGTRTFNLKASSGFIYTPEGNTIYSWGFTASTAVGAFQMPSPVLCVNQGETVAINLTNNLPMAVSMIFPGQEGVSATGGACSPATDCLLAAAAAPATGGTVSYSFVAGNPGTYLYESGTNQKLETEMGLYGAVVVRPSGMGILGTCSSLGVASAPSYAYNAARTAFDPCRENILILSEVDPDVHETVENQVNASLPIAADFTNRTPRYWLVNGRSFPDVIYANFVNWLPNQPYGGLVRVQPLDQTCNFGPNGMTGVPSNAGPDGRQGTVDDLPGSPAGCAPSMIRYVNAGFDNHPFHPHGNDMQVIGRDGRLLQGPTGQDTSFKDFARTVGAGQTYDLMFRWLLTCKSTAADQNGENWMNNAATHTCDASIGPESNAIPIIPNYKNLEFKDNDVFYSGNPYLGLKGTLTVGVTSQNVCGEYYFPWHSHALQEFVNFDALFGGMATLVRVDPPPSMQHAGTCK